MASAGTAWIPVKPKMEGWDNGLDSKVSRAGGRAGKGFGGGFKKALKFAALGFGAVLAGAAVVGKKLIDAGERAGTANARIEQIATSMGLFGKETGNVSKRLVKLAEATARQTGMDQNAIKETQAKLLTFKELAKSADQVGGAFDRATQVAVDMEAAGFGPAATTAVQLGKALNDPVKGVSALTRVGITFTDKEKEKIKALVESGRATEAQSMVLKAMENQVGGTAAATANGTDKMKVVFSQLAERIGMKLVPMVDKLATWLVDEFLPGAEKVGSFLEKELGPVFERVGGFIKNKVVPAIKDLIGRFTGASDGTNKVKKALADAEPFLRVVKAAFKGLGVVVKDVVLPVLRQVADKALPLLGKGFGLLGNVVRFWWNKIAQPIFKFFVRTIGEVMIMWGKMLRTLAKVPGFGWAKKAGDAMVDAGEKAVGLSTKIKKIPNKKKVSVNVDTSAALEKLGVFKSTLAGIDNRFLLLQAQAGATPGRASGGPVRAFRPYKVGEVGEELFVPNVDGRIVSNAQLRAMENRPMLRGAQVDGTPSGPSGLNVENLNVKAYSNRFSTKQVMDDLALHGVL